MERRVGVAGVVAVAVLLLAGCSAGLPVDDPVTEQTPGGGGSTVAGVDSLQTGDLVITEIMQNPSGSVADENGEWFEVYVAASEAVDLQGLVVEDDGSDSFTVGSSLVVQPGSYVVFANNGEASTNGGVTVDYAYTGMSLGNGDDELVLTNGSVEIDRVAYDGGPVFPDPTGASMQLDPDHRNDTDNDSGANWCESSATFGDGGLGTPGASNGACP